MRCVVGWHFDRATIWVSADNLLWQELLAAVKDVLRKLGPKWLFRVCKLHVDVVVRQVGLDTVIQRRDLFLVVCIRVVKVIGFMLDLFRLVSKYILKLLDVFLKMLLIFPLLGHLKQDLFTVYLVSLGFILALWQNRIHWVPLPLRLLIN